MQETWNYAGITITQSILGTKLWKFTESKKKKKNALTTSTTKVPFGQSA